MAEQPFLIPRSGQSPRLEGPHDRLPRGRPRGLPHDRALACLPPHRYHHGVFGGLISGDWRRMLLGLTIRDVVLIDRLSLAFRPGLCVLTGETGAGKSILLDALGLAIGRRAESGLVRHGAEQASVVAEFAVAGNHPAIALLREAGISGDLAGQVILRRTLAPDGRSRAFINDEPASIGLLRQLGDSLVEIQGQGEQRGLLDPATHRELLDTYAGPSIPAADLAAAWRDWQALRTRATEAARIFAESRAEEDLLRHHHAEIDALSPEADEED